MKNLLALASVVSAVALAANANAETWSLGVSGTVPAFVTVSSTTDTSCSPGTCTFGGEGSVKTVALDTFATAAGIVNETAGGATVNVNSNAAFTATLVSSNKALKNTVHNTTVVYEMQLADNALATAATDQAKTYGYTLGATAIPIAFSVPEGTTAVAAGSYGDTLTLTLTPGV